MHVTGVESTETRAWEGGGGIGKGTVPDPYLSNPGAGPPHPGPGLAYREMTSQPHAKMAVRKAGMP